MLVIKQGRTGYWIWHRQRLFTNFDKVTNSAFENTTITAGADPGFFLEGDAPLMNGVTNTDKPHFFAEYQLCKKAVGHLKEGAHPLHPPPRSAPALVEKSESMDNKSYTMSHTLLSLDIPIIKLTICPASNGQWRCFEMANHLSRKKTSTVFLLFWTEFSQFFKISEKMSSCGKVPPHCLPSVNTSMRVGTTYYIW